MSYFSFGCQFDAAKLLQLLAVPILELCQQGSYFLVFILLSSFIEIRFLYILLISECAPLNVQNAAQVSPSGRVVENTEVTVACSVGHSLSGEGVVTCQSDGAWSAVPRCGRYVPRYDTCL